MNPGPRHCACGRDCFNPRPPLLAGEWPAPRRPAPIPTPFQTTPAIAGGRMPGTPPAHPLPGGGFNPRPPLLAGECSVTHAAYAWPKSFQSTPAIAGGRMIQVPGTALAAERVSIHARHCWRANASAQALFRARLRFQSTPAIAGGRMWPPSTPPAASSSFNPRPPLLAGECNQTRRRLGPCGGFNPRPPLLAGE